MVPLSTSPLSTVARVSGWLQAHRRAHDVRPWQRAATCWVQAVLVLRWFKDDTKVHLLARDARVSQATAYRYLHEAVDVIADRAPELSDVLAHGLERGWAYVCLDGTLIETTRTSARSDAGHDLWYSGRHKTHGANIQVLTDACGFPVWTSPVQPGSVHDITAARTHGVLSALYPVAAAGMPTFADKGYTGAGIGIQVPTKGRHLGKDNQARNLLTALRASTERANALLKSTWRALRRVTVCPRRIGTIVAAALVLLTMQRSRW